MPPALAKNSLQGLTGLRNTGRRIIGPTLYGDFDSMGDGEEQGKYHKSTHRGNMAKHE